MSDLVSKCVLRLEVENNSSSGSIGEQNQKDEENASAKVNTSVKRKTREISVHTFPSRLEKSQEDWGILPSHVRDVFSFQDSKESFDDESDLINVFSGNPFVEVTKGILHLYKEDVLSRRNEAVTICLLGVPTLMTCHDLLAFTAPCHIEIAHIRVLRDSTPNQYMALLNFRSHEAAKEFYETFNGAPFNSLEPDSVCRAVWVSRIEWAHDDLPPVGHTELPTCPVCLERMDESVDGVLTILCNHSFHTGCLDQWSDSTCPVCRFVQSPEQAETSECEQCERSGPSPDSLWICLICGHIGCGRYQGGHAASHYRESGHCYALQLGSHRVWDYKGDNFVHRLLQNKADGKLVPAEGHPTESEGNQEKVDSVQLEFTYLLTSQLEEQRMYFEEKISQIDSQAISDIKILKEKISATQDENKQLKMKVLEMNKEKQALEKKVVQQSSRISILTSELNEEKHLGKALRSNQQQWQNKISKLEENLEKLEEQKNTETTELKEQLRDLMFYIEAQQVIAKSEDKEDIAGGSVIVGEAPQKLKRRSKKK